ncbi:serine/threonine protein kinase [Gracilinema caldarium]|nr:serine/threonine protein kinase [Gracilinema caldarium]
MQAPFNCLTPDLITDSIEEAFGISLENLIYPYPSYINRVYGLQDTDDKEYVAKFYRPGRWSQQQIREEHQFLQDLYLGECPVVLPIPDQEGATLQTLNLETYNPNSDQIDELIFHFALFPKQTGRAFDPETDEDWIRLGSLAGRIHVSGRKSPKLSRYRLDAFRLKYYIDELLKAGLIPEESLSDFLFITTKAFELLKNHNESIQSMCLHGDFHRGNLIYNSETGLSIIDFDDMCEGPAVQDLWLLLPGHHRDSRRELELILEGYTEFMEFNQEELKLIEDLRFFRMIHFLHWQSQQRFDRAFYQHFPDWGNHAFWIKCIEDLQDQLLEMGG